MFRYAIYGFLLFIFLAVLYMVFNRATSESTDSDEMDDMGYLSKLDDFIEDN